MAGDTAKPTVLCRSSGVHIYVFVKENVLFISILYMWAASVGIGLATDFVGRF